MIATIAAIAEEKKSSAIIAIIKETTFQRSWDRKRSISAIVVPRIATIAGKWFPYDRYDPCDCWTIFSQRAAIIWNQTLTFNLST